MKWNACVTAVVMCGAGTATAQTPPHAKSGRDVTHPAVVGDITTIRVLLPPATTTTIRTHGEILSDHTPDIPGRSSECEHHDQSPASTHLDHCPDIPRHARVCGMEFPLQARVRNGRLVLDEPVDLPDGTEVELIPLADGDDLDDADRARLHAALRRSAEQFSEGLGVSAETAMQRLRNRA